MKMSMGTSIIAVLLACTLFVIYGILNTRSTVIKELTVISQIISNRVEAALDWNDRDNAQKSLTDLKIKDSIIIACIYDKNGGVYARYSKDTNTVCPTIVTKSNGYRGWMKLSIYDDIVIRGDKVATIYIASDISHDVIREIPNYIVVASIILLVIGIIAYFISSHYQKLISTPILNLVKTTHDVIEQNDYSSRAKKFDDDEIGTLADSFNDMLSEVHKRDAELEEKVEQRTAELNHALKAKSNFLSNMSHEIRTPNHAVMNFSKYAEADLQDLVKGLEEYKQSPGAVEPIEKLLKIAQRSLKATTQVRNSSASQGNLLNNILDLSKMGEGKMEIDVKPADLKIAIQNVVTESEGLKGDKKLEIVFIEPTIDTKAEFDFTRIIQVLTNLVGNSFKYSDDGTITIRLGDAKLKLKDETEVPGLLFSISDEGFGIPADELELIFEKFTESSATKKQSGGTGIGLAICQEIITLHHGKIWAENNKGKGSTFTFIIPRKKIEGNANG